MAKRGAPSTYSAAIIERLCAEIASGKSLRTVCAAKDMPSAQTVCVWLGKHPEFAEQYSRAREVQCEVLAAEILDIADTCRDGQKIETRETGERFCSVCEKLVRWRGGWQHDDTDKTPLCPKGKAEKVKDTKILTGDMIERSRLQVDARKWYLSKVLPKKYGERLELAGDQAAPIVHRVEFVAPKALPAGEERRKIEQ